MAIEIAQLQVCYANSLGDAMTKSQAFAEEADETHLGIDIAVVAYLMLQDLVDSNLIQALFNPPQVLLQ